MAKGSTIKIVRYGKGYPIVGIEELKVKAGVAVGVPAFWQIHVSTLTAYE